MVFKLEDYQSGEVYLDEDGYVISQAEAQAEVDYLNEYVKHKEVECPICTLPA